MNVDRLLRGTVTVTSTSSSSTERDAMGDPAPVSSTARYRGTVWQEGRADVDETNRSVGYEQGTAVLDRSAEGNIDAHATITCDGVTWSVDGIPWPAVNPRTRATEYVSVPVRRTG